MVRGSSPKKKNRCLRKVRPLVVFVFLLKPLNEFVISPSSTQQLTVREPYHKAAKQTKSHRIIFLGENTICRMVSSSSIPSKKLSCLPKIIIFHQESESATRSPCVLGQNHHLPLIFPYFFYGFLGAPRPP